MKGHIWNAADEISNIQVGTGYESVTIGITAALEAARALDAAGLLATPEHDAEVAARTLREFTEAGAMDLWWTTTGDDWPVPEDMPRKFLSTVADRIEREAGERDE